MLADATTRATPSAGALSQTRRTDAGQQRRVGGDDHDDRTGAGGVAVAPTATGGDLVEQLAAHRHAVDREPRAPAVVRLDQDADRVAALLRADAPRTRFRSRP